MWKYFWTARRDKHINWKKERLNKQFQRLGEQFQACQYIEHDSVVLYTILEKTATCLKEVVECVWSQIQR